MDTPRRELISHLYYAALERLPDERSVFLKDACSGDETLRVELESLFLCEPASARLLERPAFVAEAPDDIAASTLLNQQLGPFKIIARLGVGGMGEVYKALDARLGRFVALKVLHDPIAEGADQDRVLCERLVCAQRCNIHRFVLSMKSESRTVVDTAWLTGMTGTRFTTADEAFSALESFLRTGLVFGLLNQGCPNRKCLIRRKQYEEESGSQA
jgi:hypothetical protein